MNPPLDRHHVDVDEFVAKQMMVGEDELKNINQSINQSDIGLTSSGGFNGGIGVNGCGRNSAMNLSCAAHGLNRGELDIFIDENWFQWISVADFAKRTKKFDLSEIVRRVSSMTQYAKRK